MGPWYRLSGLVTISDDAFDDLSMDTCGDIELAAIGLDIFVPIAPSCRKANESYRGFVVLEGLGGGIDSPV